MHTDHGFEQRAAALLQGLCVGRVANRNQLQKGHRDQHAGQRHVLRQCHDDQAIVAARHAEGNAQGADPRQCQHHGQLMARQAWQQQQAGYPGNDTGDPRRING